MRIIIPLITAMSLLLTTSCGAAQPQTHDHSSDEPVNTAATETVSTKKPESETSDTTTAPEIVETTAEYDDGELQDIVDRSLDTLTKRSISSFTTEDCIAAHPEAFEAIVSLGKRAIPFLKKYTDTDGGHYCSMARAAAYAIDPSLYDLVFESPDKSASLKLSVRSFDEDSIFRPRINYGKLSLITDSVKIELGEFDCASADVSWSDSGNYAVLTGISNNLYVSSDALLIDISNQKIIELPSLEIYNRILSDEPELRMILSFSVKSCDWSSENPTLGFELEVGAAFYPQVIHGKYTFDTKTNELIDLTYDPLPTKTPDTNLTDEEIRKIVDENLDVLTTDVGEWIPENEMIDIHPEAFGNIVALGNAASAYLDEIANDQTVSMGTSEYNRCLIASAASYVIDPDTYDFTLTSPDNSYAIKCTVESFFMMADPFIGIIYNFSVVDKSNESVLIATVIGFSINDIDQNCGIEWSPNNKYIIVEQGYHNYYTNLYLFDLEQGKCIEMPNSKQIEDFTGKLLTACDPDSGSGLSLQHFTFDSWGDDNTVRVSISLSNSTGTYLKTGTYLYDLNSETIVEIVNN